MPTRNERADHLEHQASTKERAAEHFSSSDFGSSTKAVYKQDARNMREEAITLRRLADFFGDADNRKR